MQAVPRILVLFRFHCGTWRVPEGATSGQLPAGNMEYELSAGCASNRGTESMVMDRTQRLGQGLVLTTVALLLLLPLADHHWAERVPGHAHLSLSGAFDATRHVHAGEMNASHHHGSHGQTSGDYVAFAANDAGSSGGVSIIALSVASPSPSWLLVASEGPLLPICELLKASGVSISPEAPPPRVSL